MFKVFAFLKRNTHLLSHDEYRAGHVGYHCGQSRRLKDIRGYLVNVWANESFRAQAGDDHYKALTFNEPEGFLDWWDGFPQVYFDNQEAWVNALTVEPNRATEDGLSIDPDWSLDDGPVLFDPVADRPGEFKPCHLLMHEHFVRDVERSEAKVYKLMQFFKYSEGITHSDIKQQYAPLLSRYPNSQGCIINFRDEDREAAMRGFYPDDSWGHSDEGLEHRREFCEMWDGAIEHYYTDLDDFLADRAAINPADVEQQLFQSNWYVPIDENLVVMPNRNPPPDFYFR